MGQATETKAGSKYKKKKVEEWKRGVSLEEIPRGKGCGFEGVAAKQSQ